MIISWPEVRALEDFIQQCEDDSFAENYPDCRDFEFFANNPQFIMSLGKFDEFVSFYNHPSFRKSWFSGAVQGKQVEVCQQSLFREPTGRWHFLWLVPSSRRGSFTFHSRETFDDDEARSLEIGLRTVFDHLYRIADEPVAGERLLWSPNLWTPHAQKSEIALICGTQQILKALQAERISLSDVTWQQLEEIVAEVLRTQGLEIHVVRESPQGGRDIIARGELIPGEEPISMAVEVKHRPVVGRPEVQTALWQNRHYPALLFATSGRFSAGVLDEKALPENRLRLILKDGVALGDMIRAK